MCACLRVCSQCAVEAHQPCARERWSAGTRRKAFNPRQCASRFSREKKTEPGSCNPPSLQNGHLPATHVQIRALSLPRQAAAARLTFRSTAARPVQPSHARPCAHASQCTDTPRRSSTPRPVASRLPAWPRCGDPRPSHRPRSSAPSRSRLGCGMWGLRRRCCRRSWGPRASPAQASATTPAPSSLPGGGVVPSAGSDASGTWAHDSFDSVSDCARLRTYRVRRRVRRPVRMRRSSPSPPPHLIDTRERNRPTKPPRHTRCWAQASSSQRLAAAGVDTAR